VLDADGYAGLRLCGSDCHWPDTVSAAQWAARTEMSEDEFSRRFGQTGDGLHGAGRF